MRFLANLQIMWDSVNNTNAADDRSFSALMNIEKSFLNKLQSKPSFLNEVTDLLAMKNRRIELTYKQ
jgi:hypothetical protein